MRNGQNIDMRSAQNLDMRTVNTHLPLVPKMNNPLQGSSMVKYEMPDDPYSFVDDEHMMVPVQCPPVIMQQVPKKRGRKKKIKTEDLPMHEQHNPHG